MFTIEQWWVIKFNLIAEDADQKWGPDYRGFGKGTLQKWNANDKKNIFNIPKLRLRYQLKYYYYSIIYKNIYFLFTFY